MSLPKKTLLAAVSAAALVASVGFVQAQSPDQDALAEVNVNNNVDRGEDTRTYPADRLPANNYDPAPVAAADSTWAADTAMNQPANDAATNTATTGMETGNTYAPGAGATTTTTTTAPAAAYDSSATSTSTTPATTAPAAAGTSTMPATAAPETRIDLSPPSDPLYNLPPEGGERAPRADRN